MSAHTLHSSGLPVQQRNLLRLLGFVLQQNGQPERAAVLFSALHVLDPDDLDVLHSLALAHVRLGHAEESLGLLQPVADAGRASALTHLLLAQALVRAGRMPEAVQSMRRFVQGRASQGAHA